MRCSTEPRRASEVLLEGLSLLVTDGPLDSIPVLQQAVSAFLSEDVGIEVRLRWSWLAGRAASFLWDYDGWDVLTARQVQVARDAGALTMLPLTLSARAGLHMFAGELELAESVLEQADAVAGVIDKRSLSYSSLGVAAFRGRESIAHELIDAATKEFTARGDGLGLNIAFWSTAVLNNGLAHYNDAFTAAEQVLDDRYEVMFAPLASVELIEAASRIGRETEAATTLERLAESTSASGTDWALAIEGRCRALLSHDVAAETLYREAIERQLVIPCATWSRSCCSRCAARYSVQPPRRDWRGGHGASIAGEPSPSRSLRWTPPGAPVSSLPSVSLPDAAGRFDELDAGRGFEPDLVAVVERLLRGGKGVVVISRAGCSGQQLTKTLCSARAPSPWR